MYTKQTRFDYTLYDAFNTLGLRLYGSQWNGYEIWAHRVEDPTKTLEAKNLLFAKIEKVGDQIQECGKERGDVIGKSAISSLNGKIQNLKNSRDELYYEYHQLDDVRDHNVSDSDQWKRFEYSEGIFLQALGKGELSIYCIQDQVVPPRMWVDFPKGFDFDIQNSLIFWPLEERSKKIGSGRIRQGQFEKWLETVLPIILEEVEKLTPEQHASIYFRDLIPKWDGIQRKPYFKELLMDKFNGLSGNGFVRIWDSHATRQMKSPGRRVGT